MGFKTVVHLTLILRDAVTLSLKARLDLALEIHHKLRSKSLRPDKPFGSGPSTVDRNLGRYPLGHTPRPILGNFQVGCEGPMG